MDMAHGAVLLGAAAGAGGVDAIVGGGGLIQLPTLLLAYPNLLAAVALGTNKLASISGTSTAAATYLRRTADWKPASKPTAACWSGPGLALPSSRFCVLPDDSYLELRKGVGVLFPGVTRSAVWGVGSGAEAEAGGG
ncbi:hypothetical protein ABH935_009062 [Catenulispora sp. GAS73]|uniref:TSUP family transporter n=1 Tax=Catenulispora sp. GAS73 TaxID=3156269 RepID=UPI0035144A3D